MIAVLSMRILATCQYFPVSKQGFQIPLTEDSSFARRAHPLWMQSILRTYNENRKCALPAESAGLTQQINVAAGTRHDHFTSCPLFLPLVPAGGDILQQASPSVHQSARYTK